MSAAPFLVIMAGGSGTRFWPKSTSKRPKQLMKFVGDRSLLRQTIDRFKGLVPDEQTWVVTTRKLESAISADAGPKIRILGEPAGRNTAPCIYWAAREISALDPKAIMLVMPSDHTIAKQKGFLATVELAVDWARTHDDLITLGVAPTRPETGYGYLKTGTAAGKGCLQVEAFVEKPEVEKAREYLAQGGYLWNGGMFVWRVDVILAAFERYMPEARKVWNDHGGKVDEAYPQMPAISVDYGIMEKASNVVTFPLDCGWDDLGSWTSLETLASDDVAKHPAGVVSANPCVSIDSTGNIVDAPDRLVALLGVEDLIIVDTGEALLVARKDRAQDIRKIVDEVRKKRPDLT